MQIYMLQKWWNTDRWHLECFTMSRWVYTTYGTDVEHPQQKLPHHRMSDDCFTQEAMFQKTSIWDLLRTNHVESEAYTTFAVRPLLKLGLRHFANFGDTSRVAFNSDPHHIGCCTLRHVAHRWPATAVKRRLLRARKKRCDRARSMFQEVKMWWGLWLHIIYIAYIFIHIIYI